MKNIHILPTTKLSRIHYYNCFDPLGLSKEYLQWKSGRHIYITSDVEIKEGDYVYFPISNEVLKIGNDPFESSLEIVKDNKDCKKIILTTDPKLIADGVQVIDDEFLEWVVKNPSCESVNVDLIPVNEFDSEIIVTDYGFDRFIYKIVIPKEEPKYTTSNLDNDKYKDFSVLKEDLRKYPLTHDECFKEEPTQDFYKIGDFDGHCDDACKYHCNKGNTQLAECLNKPKQESNIVFVTTEQAVRIFGAKKLNKLLKEHKQETLEEVAERIFKIYSNNTSLAEGHYDYMMDKEDFKEASLEIANWQQERSYSEEGVFNLCREFAIFVQRKRPSYKQQQEWFEQFKKK
jgi:hypothetical protein